MSATPALKFKPRRGNVFRASHQVGENSELFKELESSAQFQWGGSPLPSSHVAHWEGPKRNPPLVPNTVLFEAVKGHWTQEGYERLLGIRRQTVFRPMAYVGLQPLGLAGGEEKSKSPFVFTPRPPIWIGSSMEVFQRAIARTLNADLFTDHRPSASPE